MAIGPTGGDESGPGTQTVLSEINITPFVDVMLVLLVIFMVTAPLLTQGVEVNLPRLDADNLEQMDEQPVVVSVNAEGTCFVLDEAPASVSISYSNAPLQLQPSMPSALRRTGNRRASSEATENRSS